MTPLTRMHTGEPFRSLLFRGMLAILWGLGLGSQHAFPQGMKESLQKSIGTPDKQLRSRVVDAVNSNRLSIGGVACVVEWQQNLNLPVSENENVESSSLLIKQAGTDPEFERQLRAGNGRLSRKVFLCGENLLAESYVGDYLDSVITTNGRELELFTSNQLLTPSQSGPVLLRKSFADEMTKSLPLADPRDFGAPCGIGQLAVALSDWSLEASNEIIDPKTKKRYIRLTVKDNQPYHVEYAENWILLCDSDVNYLPVSVTHRVGNLYVSKAEVQYSALKGNRDAFFPVQATISFLKDLSPDGSAFDHPENFVSTVKFLVHDVAESLDVCGKSPFRPVESGTLVRDVIRGDIYTARPTVP
ncbi:hypothetical protein [Planctomicrobium sp. SH527]|uniref:hypothetical protein n=1 Tax=Planctomicrobium sp. SH527 TaxID=3448123 RepID=UPI003F5C337C